MFERYATDEFESEFTYSGNDLGSRWTPQETAFRVWAPTAQEVSLRLYRGGAAEGSDLLRQVSMTRDVQGTWVARLPGNLKNIYYTYLVLVDGQFNEACDPYARAVGVNGQRAMVIDLADTNPQGWEADTDPHAGASLTDAVIYELHVRDFSMHRGCRLRNRGKFLALTQTGAVTKGKHPAGLDHIRQLGVTHVQLLPVFDFGFTDEARHNPQYNWGYDPVNFNVPEGSYATDPFHGAVRVREMKRMVKGLHDAGLSVVMDVVYNHVYDSGSFCFNKIVPGYFSRISPEGCYSNGSYCGNDTASERAMVRKYIVDSVCYWAEEYHIDGFRFDLAGLLDIATIRAVMEAVHSRHPNVLFYGEGWTMPTVPTKPGISLAVQTNSAQLPLFAFFSDTTRDLLRGSNFSDTALGFVSGGSCQREALDACFLGMPHWAAQPEQCVHYVSCHDNHTLFDRLALAAPEAPREMLARMNRLAAAFYLLSQGVPFFQAGEEMLRSKPGRRGRFDDNSYRSGDRVNALRWEALDEPECARTVDFYRGLIAFRKAHPSLRLRTREAVWSKVHPQPWDDGHTAIYRIDEDAQELFVAFNAGMEEITVPLPEGAWEVHIRDDQAGTAALDTVQGSLMVPPVCAVALTRKKPVEVVAALLWEKDRFLICQRPAGKARGLLWEFPGGKVEPGETLAQALTRECQEELAVQVRVEGIFRQRLYEYPDICIRLTLMSCILNSGVPQALEHAALRWVHPGQTGQYEFCPADQWLLQEVIRIYGNKPPLNP